MTGNRTGDHFVTELTDEQERFFEVFEKQLCNVSKACKVAGIARSTFYAWSNKSDTFRQKRNDIEQGIIDFAESALLKLIKQGNVTATIFFLKTKGFDRGYTETQNININEKRDLTSEEADEIREKYRQRIRDAWAETEKHRVRLIRAVATSDGKSLSLPKYTST